MLPIRVILYATDLSEQARRAYQVARSLARDYGARLIVLHAIERVRIAEEAVEYDEAGRLVPMPEGYPAHHEAIKARLRELYSSGKLPMQFLVEDGEPAETILRAADQAEASLIVIGTHGRRGLRRLMAGSVAEAVLRRSKCPVLTVRSPVADPAPIPLKRARRQDQARRVAAESGRSTGPAAEDVPAESMLEHALSSPR